MLASATGQVAHKDLEWDLNAQGTSLPRQPQGNVTKIASAVLSILSQLRGRLLKLSNPSTCKRLLRRWPLGCQWHRLPRQARGSRPGKPQPSQAPERFGSDLARRPQADLARALCSEAVLLLHGGLCQDGAVPPCSRAAASALLGAARQPQRDPRPRRGLSSAMVSMLATRDAAHQAQHCEQRSAKRLGSPSPFIESTWQLLAPRCLFSCCRNVATGTSGCLIALQNPALGRGLRCRTWQELQVKATRQASTSLCRSNKPPGTTCMNLRTGERKLGHPQGKEAARCLWWGGSGRSGKVAA